MVIHIAHSSEKKEIKKETKGQFNEYKYKKEEDKEKMFLSREEILRRFSLNTKTIQDFYVISDRMQDITYHIQNERWFILYKLTRILLNEY